MERNNLLAKLSFFLLSILLISALGCLTVFGQAGTSTIRGTVTDPQGNVVAGATVTLTNLATNASRTTTSSNDGVFNFEQVSVADYRVEVQTTGFKKAVVNVHALVAKVTPVDVQLEIGNVSETVVVTSGVGEALLNRDDGSLGNNFVNQQITQLP